MTRSEARKWARLFAGLVALAAIPAALAALAAWARGWL